MSILGVGALQIAGQRSGNIELVEQQVRSACTRYPWLSLITLSELAIHGSGLRYAEPAGGATERRMQALAAELGIWLVPGSLYEQRNGLIYNTSPVINPAGEVVARYDKMCPFLPYATGVEPGQTYVVFDVPDVGRIGIIICYDLWFPEIIRNLACMGAEAILVPTMTNSIDRDVELAMARAAAASNQLYMIDVNSGGDQGLGRSVVYGPGGECQHEGGSGGELIAVELDFSYVRRVRDRGWNGLGQVLKSFRDMPASFPYHEGPESRQQALAHLGSLTVPTAPDRDGASPASRPKAGENRFSAV